MRFRTGCLAVFFAAIASAVLAQPADPLEAYAWDVSRAGAPLLLDGYRQTFRDDFNRPSITGAGGKGPWFAPVHSDFGGARFMPPDGAHNPFSFKDGVLRIAMTQEDGVWRSGLMQTVNDKGRGFLQELGYFEMRARFPRGQGSWPAFWLLSANEFYPDRYTRPRIEIDVIEAYGGSDFDGHHSTVHVKPPRTPSETSVAKARHKSHYTDLTRIADARTGKPLFANNANMFDGAFHTYGALLTESAVVIYYDGRELGRHPMVKEFRTPLYMLVDLALLPKEAEGAKAPMYLDIDYVRALAKPKQ